MNKKYFTKAMDIAYELDNSLYVPLPKLKVLSLESDTSDIDILNTDQIENDSEFKIDPTKINPEDMIKNTIEVENTDKELNDNSRELEKTIVSSEELLNSLIVNEELLRSSYNTISPLDVSKACYSFHKHLNVLGSESEDYRNLHNVNNNFFSKENNPGISPAQALNIVTEDMKDILSRTKEKIKAIWEMIIKGLKKLWEVITSLFVSLKKSAMKLKEKVVQNYPTKPAGKFKPYEYIPSLVHLYNSNESKLSKIDLKKVIDVQKGALVYALSLSNTFTTFLKHNPNNPDHNELLSKLANQHDKIIKTVFTTIPELKEAFGYLAIGSRYFYSISLKVNPTKLYFSNPNKIVCGENKISNTKYDYEINLLDRNEMIRFLDFIIQFDKKSFVNSIKEARKNTEYLKENLNIKHFIFTQIGNYIYSNLTSKIVKSETDFLHGLFKVCEKSYKLGVNAEDNDEHIDVEVIE